MSASERSKGQRGEREVIEMLRKHGFKYAKRTSDGTRQQFRGDIAYGPSGTHIEVKRQERLNVPAALAQVRADAKEGDMAILIHRPSRAPWCATLALSDLLPLLPKDDR